jgi:curved DNA-binding protein CbpA
MTPTNDPDFYGLLGVKHTFAESTIRKAYRAKVKVLEADLGEDYVSSEQYQALEEALGVLSDPEARSKYDAYWRQTYAGGAAAGDGPGAKRTTVRRAARPSSRPQAQVYTHTNGENYRMYDPALPAEIYERGQIWYFPKVRSWLDKYALVEAFGKVMAVDSLDGINGELRYVEVSFYDTRKMNTVDLGKDLRRFIVSQAAAAPAVAA